jgi:hypothetical protein
MLCRVVWYRFADMSEVLAACNVRAVAVMMGELLPDYTP